MDTAILARFSRDRAADAIQAQVRRIAEHATSWLLTHELHRLAILLRESASRLDQAADQRDDVGKRA